MLRVYFCAKRFAANGFAQKSIDIFFDIDKWLKILAIFRGYYDVSFTKLSDLQRYLIYVSSTIAF